MQCLYVFSKFLSSLSPSQRCSVKCSNVLNDFYPFVTSFRKARGLVFLWPSSQPSIYIQTLLKWRAGSTLWHYSQSNPSSNELRGISKMPFYISVHTAQLCYAGNSNYHFKRVSETEPAKEISAWARVTFSFLIQARPCLKLFQPDGELWETVKNINS